MAMSIIALLLLKLYAAISVSPKSQVVAAHTVLSNSWRHTPQQVTEINSLHFASQAVAVEVAAKKTEPLCSRFTKFSRRCTKYCRA